MLTLDLLTQTERLAPGFRLPLSSEAQEAQQTPAALRPSLSSVPLGGHTFWGPPAPRLALCPSGGQVSGDLFLLVPEKTGIWGHCLSLLLSGTRRGPGWWRLGCGPHLAAAPVESAGSLSPPFACRWKPPQAASHSPFRAHWPRLSWSFHWTPLAHPWKCSISERNSNSVNCNVCR